MACVDAKIALHPESSHRQLVIVKRVKNRQPPVLPTSRPESAISDATNARMVHEGKTLLLHKSICTASKHEVPFPAKTSKFFMKTVMNFFHVCMNLNSSKLLKRLQNIYKIEDLWLFRKVSCQF